MAMGKERSKALHNFTMPSGLRWGNQRFLRCMKVNSDGEASHLRRFSSGSSGGSDHQHHHPIQQRRTTREGERDSPLDFLHESHKVGPTPSRARRRFSGGDDADDEDGIAATREKVMLDLQTAADKIKNAIFKDGLEEGEVSVPPPPPPPPPPPRQPSADAEAEAHCPWNLRTRRASSRAAASGFASARNGGSPTAAATGANDVGRWKTLRIDAPLPNSGSSQMRTAAAVFGAPQKSSIYRNDASDAAATSGEKRERVKFSVPLSKKDIEEDFYAMVGHRPPRRPKKRARNVQKQLDTLFPGLSLDDITAEKYKVNEVAP